MVVWGPDRDFIQTWVISWLCFLLPVDRPFWISVSTSESAFWNCWENELRLWTHPFTQCVAHIKALMNVSSADCFLLSQHTLKVHLKSKAERTYFKRLGIVAVASLVILLSLALKQVFGDPCLNWFSQRPFEVICVHLFVLDRYLSSTYYASLGYRRRKGGHCSSTSL